MRLLQYDFIHRHSLYHYSSLYILEEYNQPSLIHSLNPSTSVDLLSGSYHSPFTIDLMTATPKLQPKPVRKTSEEQLPVVVTNQRDFIDDRPTSDEHHGGITDESDT